VHVAVIAAGLFPNTRSFLRLLAARPGVRVSLLKGGTEPTAALRAVRDAHRLWFEGAGPLLSALAGRPAGDWLGGAYLRIGPEDVDRLPTPAPWRLVKTVFVPDRATADRVRALDPSPASAGTRVERAGEAPDLVDWVHAKPGDLQRGHWNQLLRIAEHCRGRVRIAGNPPPELADVLTRAYGLEVVGDGPADTHVTWRGGAGLAPYFSVHVAEGAAAEMPPPADPPPPDPAADDPPLVSVGVPVYNGQDTIDRCLASLRRQTYPNLEIVVVDDGSTDATADRIAQHLDDPRVRYFDKPHSGRPESRNRCVAEARGRYIAWLDADDEAMPNRIRLQVQAARAAGDAEVVHADGLLLDSDGTVTGTRRGRSYPADDLPARFLAGVAGIVPVLNATALVRRDLYDRLGGYDPAFPRCQDFEFWCRCAIAGDVRFVHLALPLIKVYQSPLGQQTRTEALDARLRIARQLVEALPAETLMDPVARDLQDPLEVVVGRTLLSAGMSLGAPCEHALFSEAEAHLDRAADGAGPATRAEIGFLRGQLEAYRRQEGGGQPAPAHGLLPAGTGAGLGSFTARP